ncbi:Uncharacterised protein [Raoultella ornithinolytica]|jgi:hypothetical protein|nr:Uncharacterised protein [Raoultella ornithinolytica]
MKAQYKHQNEKWTTFGGKVLNVAVSFERGADLQMVIAQQMRRGMMAPMPGAACISSAQFSNSQLSNFNLD